MPGQLGPEWLAERTLFPPGSASSTGSYAKRLWSLRYFISATASGKMTARNQGMILGRVWLILEPFLYVITYYFVFEVLLSASRGVDNFFLFLTVGRLVFASHQAAVLGAAGSLANNPALVRETSMPKAILPVGSAIGTFYQWGIDLVILVIVAFLVGEFPRFSWLLMIPMSIGLLATNIGIGLLLAPLVARYQDLRRALPVYFRLTFFTTGIMFPLEAYVNDLNNPNFYWVVIMLNPVYGYIKGFQWAVFGYDLGHPGWAMLSGVVWSVVLLPLGFLRFVRQERRVGAFRYKLGS